MADPGITALLSSFENQEAGEASLDLLEKFYEKVQDRFEFPELGSFPKREKIWIKCFDNLRFASSKSTSSLVIKTLDLIRVISRDRQHLEEILSKNPELVATLLPLAHLKERSPSGVKEADAGIVEAAVKALCNVGKQSNVGINAIAQDACLKNLTARIGRLETPYDLLSLDLKLLFLVTALKPNFRGFVRHQCNGFNALNAVLFQVTKNGKITASKLGERKQCGSLDLDPKSPCVLGTKDSDLACDVLKVMYNLSLSEDIVEKSSEDGMDDLASLIRLLLLSSPEENPTKKVQLVHNIVNLFTSIPEAFGRVLEGTDDEEAMKPVDVLIALLDEILTNVDQYKDTLFATLAGITFIAKANPPVRRYMRHKILPGLKGTDAMTKPEEGETLRNKLVRFLTNPSIKLKEGAATLLFVLCKENVGRLVKYTGLGNAAGTLSARGLLGGAPSLGADDYSPDDDSESDTEEYKTLADNINPVTGTWEDPNRPRPLEGMSDEQKEYEAMRLVSLIDKMNRQGLVRPVTVGADGRVRAVDHVLELQEGIDPSKLLMKGDEDSDDD